MAASSGPPPTDNAATERILQDWLAEQRRDNPVVDAVEHDPETGRWFLRIRGEDKDIYSVWFTPGQRTLHYETYVMPAPEENHARFYEHLLRRNRKLYGVTFWIGDEDAVFLGGQLDNGAVSPDELDRVLGTIYATVELCFRSALRIGFASRLPPT